MNAEERRRVELTVAVRDTDAIGKVPDAGEVRAVDGRRVQVMHNGLVIEEGCYHGEMMTEIIRRLRGHHEPQEEAAFDAVLRQLRDEPSPGSPTMVELGSFWAYYSMWFKHAFADGRSVMVEPDPSNLEVGRRNFALNALDGEFVNAAVGRRHDARAWVPCESDGRVRRLRTVTLGGLMREVGAQRLDLVLCDVQGAETVALEAAAEEIRQGRIRFLVISTHHHLISTDPLTHQRCRDIVREAGAAVLAEHTVNESCSGDGLIVASTDPRDRDLAISITCTRAQESIFGELEYDLAAAHKRERAVRRLYSQAGARVLGLAHRDWRSARRR